MAASWLVSVLDALFWCERAVLLCVFTLYYWTFTGIHSIFSRCCETRRAKSERQSLVVIGGGFAGCYVAKRAERHFDVTLIDTKDYFEFTPSVPVVIRDPSHAGKTQMLHSVFLDLNRSRFLNAKVSSLDTSNRVVTTKQGDLVNYDKLLICTGTRYNEPFKENEGKAVVKASRCSHLNQYAKKIRSASRILVVGGGIVGVEVAAELAFGFPLTAVTLVHSGSVLMNRSDKVSDGARKYAHSHLVSNNVNVVYNTRIDSNVAARTYCSSDGRKFEADVVILCTGVQPNTSFLTGHSFLDHRGYVKVDKHLQVIGEPHVFAAGDVTSIREEKLAQTAESHGHVVLQNLLDAEHQDVYTPSEGMGMVISLGPHKGIFVFRGWTLTGLFPAMMKVVVEIAIMSSHYYRRSK